MKAQKVLGYSYLIGRIRQRRCSVADCTNKTRLFLAMPMADVEEDGGPGIGGVAVCGDCLPDALYKLDTHK